MKLYINNFAKIRNADVTVDGITVIAGENNTGKSTIGKILFSLFNSISGIEEKIAGQRMMEVQNGLQKLFREYFAHGERGRETSVYSPSMSRRIALRAVKKLTELEDPDDLEICEVVRKAVEEMGVGRIRAEEEEIQEIINRATEKVIAIFALPRERILLEVLSRYFGEVFHEQMNSLKQPESMASIRVEIKNRKIELAFQNNLCTKFDADIALLHKAIYIDNPFVTDRLNQYHSNVTDQFLEDLLTREVNGNIMDGIIGAVMAKEKLSEVYRALEAVVDGRVVVKGGDEFYLENDRLGRPVSFPNLSTGLKSFVIIKMLMEQGAIEEKDVMILDEPEVHLHPQWQVAYAELIVLLQKYFDLSIVVTTHSPYFLDAIDLFSVKHGIKEKVNYYLSSIEDDWVDMQCVTGDIEKIYQKMASPIQLLDTLRHDLNNG